ncbi:MAG: hypothetical protein GY705_10680 [Bacteroidetes bacterium]|nr:hypothetical protein [Bacteroidota bacterium]
MKIIACILSAYMLFLAVLPCADMVQAFHGDDDEVQASQCQTADEASACCHAEKANDDYAQDKEEDHNSCDDGDCSPFCNCTCCGTTLLADLKSEAQSNFPEIINTRPQGLSSFTLLSYSHSIWHPPSLS